jgi:hypothetical protein
LSRAPRGTDGCSIPTYGIPLRKPRATFARFGSGIGLREGRARAARRLRRAVAAAPYMVGGAERFDSVVMQRLGERVFCKVGAEGVARSRARPRPAGIAIKITDGNNARAAESCDSAARRDQRPRWICRSTPRKGEFMRECSDVTLRSWNGIEVGARCAATLCCFIKALQEIHRGPDRHAQPARRNAPVASSIVKSRAVHLEAWAVIGRVAAVRQPLRHRRARHRGCRPTCRRRAQA